MILPKGHIEYKSLVDCDFLELTLDEAIKKHICNTLILCQGNKAKAAKALNIERSTLYRSMKRYGIIYEKILKF